ncbi:MAG: Fructose dehydrogenase small subunit [Stenotrophomonas maltophilia]|nr:MAG: Fructose dehydrogenase small subunit [Stenotrophomonas maltophilia]
MNAYPQPLSRRGFLRGSAVLAGGLSLLPLSPQLMAAVLDSTPQGGFMRLSLLLTARSALSSQQGQRIFDALGAIDTTFPQKLSDLQQAIAADGFSDMRQFGAFAARHDAALKATALTIISAWYLGYVGTPAGHSSEDNTRFIAFCDALMYQPTLDATVIPTYSRGHTNYWVEPPASIAQD